MHTVHKTNFQPRPWSNQWKPIRVVCYIVEREISCYLPLEGISPVYRTIRTGLYVSCERIKFEYSARWRTVIHTQENSRSWESLPHATIYYTQISGITHTVVRTKAPMIPKRIAGYEMLLRRRAMIQIHRLVQYVIPLGLVNFSWHADKADEILSPDFVAVIPVDLAQSSSHLSIRESASSKRNEMGVANHLSQWCIT